VDEAHRQISETHRQRLHGLQPEVEQARAMGVTVGELLAIAVEETLPGTRLVPELPAQEHAHSGNRPAGRRLCCQGQALPSLTFADFTRLQTDLLRHVQAFVALPGLLPHAMTDHESRYRNQLRALLVEPAIIFWIPAVIADQHAEAPGRCVDYIDSGCIAGCGYVSLIVDRAHLPLWLTERRASRPNTTVQL